MKLTADKKKLLDEINNSIIDKYKAADVPMVFKTSDCADDEWAGRDMNTGKISKLKMSSSDSGTKLFDENGKQVV